MRAALLLSVLLFLSSCATGGGASDTITLPRLPIWKTPAVQETFTATQVFEAVRQYAPQAQFIGSDAFYTRINHEFAVALVDWTRRALWSANSQVKRGFEWTPESLDCDKFAKAFTLFVEIAASRAGTNAQPLAFRTSVNQVHSFGGVRGMPPPNNGHALVVLVTDRGVFVVEIQSGVMSTLADYPNREYVWRVVIGG